MYEFKGQPAVHGDENLIVSHIAIVISDMDSLRSRLTKMGVKFRKNISVPNPGEGNKAIVNQAFVRDPDGYYIEFCNCDSLDDYLHDLGDKQIEANKAWSMSTVVILQKFSHILKEKAENARKMVQWLNHQSSLNPSNIVR